MAHLVSPASLNCQKMTKERRQQKGAAFPQNLAAPFYIFVIG
ncbi:hypothetical protein MNBD_ALPHA11-989 [hydrothermal vent metagenome]|uniref:Uncharacterized protein n=1 Tax=hydrothermal vent metagenome TaxID=652676 RepID=A0A3B0TMS5_9ZZZZ